MRREPLGPGSRRGSDLRPGEAPRAGSGDLARTGAGSGDLLRGTSTNWTLRRGAQEFNRPV